MSLLTLRMKYLIRFKLYSYYSWGLPLVLVGIAHLLDHLSRLVFDLSIFPNLFSLAFLADYKPKYGSSLCWFNNKKGLAVFFALPLGAVVLENFVLFIFTIYGIHTQLRATRWKCQFL